MGVGESNSARKGIPSGMRGEFDDQRGKRQQALYLSQKKRME